MSRRMLSKPIKTTRKKRNQAPMSPEMQAVILDVASVAANLSRKEEVTQQVARKAISDTIEDWVAFLTENDLEAVEEFYYEICMLATAGNRRRIAKHTPIPVGVFERVEDDLQSQREEIKREAAKAQAKDSGDDSEERVPA